MGRPRDQEVQCLAVELDLLLVRDDLPGTGGVAAPAGPVAVGSDSATRVDLLYANLPAHIWKTLDEHFQCFAPLLHRSRRLRHPGSEDGLEAGVFGLFPQLSSIFGPGESAEDQSDTRERFSLTQARHSRAQRRPVRDGDAQKEPLSTGLRRLEERQDSSWRRSSSIIRRNPSGAASASKTR